MRSLGSAQGLLALAARSCTSQAAPASSLAIALQHAQLLSIDLPTSLSRSSYSTQATRHLLSEQGVATAASRAPHQQWRVQHHPHHRPQLQHVRGMFIQTQPTPNPHSLMFVPGQKVMESGSHEFPNARSGMVSPLAKRLFAIDGVTSVFLGSDFITITKQDDYGWASLKPLVFSAIMDHYASGAPLFTDAATLAASDTAIQEEDDEVVAMIKELLETRIRPAVQEDGGDIAFRTFDADTGIVTLKMMGACSGCPSSAVTLKSGIENMLMHYIPEVKGVEEAPPGEEEVLAIKEFEKLDAQLEGTAATADAPTTASSSSSSGSKPASSTSTAA